MNGMQRCEKKKIYTFPLKTTCTVIYQSIPLQIVHFGELFD